LGQETDDHKDGVHDKEAAVLQTGNGDSEESDNEDVEAQDDDVGRCHEEDGRPEVELFDLNLNDPILCCLFQKARPFFSYETLQLLGFEMCE